MKSYQVSLILSVLALVCYVGIVTAVQEGDGEGAEEIEAVADGKDVEDGKDGNFLSRFFNMFQSGQKKTEEDGEDSVETEEVPDEKDKISTYLIKHSAENLLKPEQLKAIVEDKFKDELTALTNAMKANEEKPEGERTKFAEISELYQICEVSPDKCSPDGFVRSVIQGLSYSKYIKQLDGFASYCRFTKLPKYCAKMIDDVTKKLLDSVSEDEKALVKPYWDKLVRDGVIKEALINEKGIFHEITDSVIKSMKKTYYTIMRSKLGDGVSTDQEEIYLLKFSRAATNYLKLYKFLGELRQGDEPENDSTKYFMDFGKVATAFPTVFSEVFQELKGKILKESGKPYEKHFIFFTDLTDEQLVEDQKRRKALAESELQSPN